MCIAVLCKCSSVVYLCITAGCDRNSLLCYRKCSLCVCDVIAACHILISSILNNCRTCCIIARSCSSLTSGYSYRFDSIACCKIRVSITVLGKSCSVVYLGIAAGCNGYGLLCYFKCSLCICDVIVVCHILICSILNNRRTCCIIARSCRSLTAGYCCRCDRIAFCKAFASNSILGKRRSVVYL